MRIDAHHHFWKYDPVRHAWIDGEMAAIRRDYLPEDLVGHLSASDISGTVLVQVQQLEAENRWFLELAATHDWIRGVVGWIDLQAPDLAQRLESYRAYPKLKGFRHLIQAEPDPGFMARPAFRSGVSLLGRYDLSFDLLVLPHQLPQALDLVKAFPDQRFVIDHLAKPIIRQGLLEPWTTHMRALAGFEQVHVKVSGLVTEADWHGWQARDFDPYLKVALDAFGPDRLLFGSDWPVCELAASYATVAGIAADFFSPLSDSEQAAIFGNNAIRFYRL